MAHYTIPQGMRRFARTIPTKRDGACEYCTAATRSGIDYAGVDGAGKWHSVCATCAGSITEQVKGVIRSMDALSQAHPDVTADVSGIDMTALPAIVTGTATEAASYDMLINLVNARTLLGDAIADAARAAAPADPTITALRAIASDAQASPRDRDFAASLVAGFDRYGSLTERQRSAAERMIARGAASTVVLPDVECGLYVNAEGTIHKLYMTQNDRMACKVLIVLGEHGSFDYVKGGVRIVREAVAAGTTRKLSQTEATAFGRLHGFCVACARDLDDDRSLAVGYGPVCAENNHWYYPTYTEAAGLLQRPVTAPNGRTYDVPTA